MAIGDAQRYEIQMDNFPLFKMYHYAAGTSNDKDIWSDAGKTTPLAQPVVADANGQLTFFADGIYRMVFKDSADVSISGMDYDNFQITADMSTTFEANQGTVLPGAAAANKGHGFLLFDVSSNILGFYKSDGTQYKAMTTFTAAGDQIFDSVITKDEPEYNIRHADWGAVPGGAAATNTAAIQSVINAISSAGKGVMYVPQGVYDINGSFDINNTPIKIRGDGIGLSVLRQTTTDAIFDYDTNNIENVVIIRDLSLYATQANTGGAIDCLWPSTSSFLKNSNCLISNVEITPNPSDSATAYFSRGIGLSDAKKADLQSIFIRGADNSVANGEAIKLQGTSRYAILNKIRCHYQNTGIFITATTENFSISDSEFVTCDNGIKFNVSGLSNYSLDNVRFENIYSKCISTPSAIPELVKIIGCKFEKSSDSTEDWRGILGDYVGIKIGQNVFKDNGSASGTDIGIDLDIASDASIIGNSISGVDTGINITSNTTDVNINGNSIQSTTTGIFVGADTADFIINSNRIVDATTGVIVDAGISNDYIISNNNFEGCTLDIRDDGTGTSKKIIGNVPIRDGTTIGEASGSFVITIPVFGTFFILTVGNRVRTINGGRLGRSIILLVPNSLLIEETVGNLKLAGDMTGSGNADTLSLIYDGTDWLEISRSVN